jgi:multidrug efflux pump subunit AcrA (membrane-fusion protein)
VLTGCKEGQVEARPGLSHNTWNLPVVEVAAQELPKSYSASGSVVSDQRIEVATRTTGFIRKILVYEGEQVVKGQDLIQLDNSDVEDAIRQAQAAVGKATSALKDAQTDLARHTALIKSGSISKITLRKTRLQRDLAKAWCCDLFLRDLAVQAAV